MPKETMEQFLEVTADPKGLSVRQIIDRLDAADFWNDPHQADESKRRRVRKLLRTATDEQGFPLFVRFRKDGTPIMPGERGF